MKKDLEPPVNRKFKPIDTDEEQYKVLFELGHLDDCEDWTLYQEQEKRFDIEIDIDTYSKYTRKNR